jgi:uncharacterized membrane protein YesL
MNFWTREVAGWMLVMIGLFVFYRCYTLVTLGNHYILEGIALAFAGTIIFRGGIHLLKVAVAAQVVMEARKKTEG